MYVYLFLLISFIFPLDIFQGKVVDSVNRPIYGANIQVLDEDFGSSTDSEGHFIIDNLENNNFTIKISHIAFQDKLIHIKNISKNLVIIMTPSSLEIDRVVVTGTKSNRHIKDAPVLTHVIGQEDIQNSSYSNVKDILEMAMPNVQMVSSNHGDDRVKIQGLDNKYLTFLVDGDRVSGEYAGNIDFSMLGLSNVDKIEVIEGAMSTLYGSGAIGGVVNIITKKNKEPYWFIPSIQYDNPIGISQSMNAGFNRGILNYNVNIQYTESDGYDLTPDLDNVYNKTLDESNSKILNHSLILSPSDSHKFKFKYKEYFSRINTYEYFAGNLVVGAPLNRYDDEYYNIKYDYKISSNQNFKIAYIEEKYMKYFYYPYYYSNNQHIFNPEEFINGILDRQEINLQYNVQDFNYKRLIGLESYNEDYSSFNIYKPEGNILQESIFEGQDLTMNDNNISLYFYEERNFKDNRILSFGLRIQNVDKKDIILPSLSYLIKGENNYNYRVSYSCGYRNSSIKERYYKWQDHFGGPAIIGNPDLEPTKNNYFSISLDKRTSINDFSVDIYRNNIDNMISTKYAYNIEESTLELQYKNFKKVLINGMNVHYYRKITDKLKLKFVYNLTDASSNSNEILEGISKHALRLNLYYKLFNKVDIVGNIKYAGKKFIFDQEEAAIGNESIEELNSYFISDLYSVTSFENMVFKIGMKNIFNYKDSNRLFSDILNNYDPGRRIFIELSLRIKGDINDK